MEKLACHFASLYFHAGRLSMVWGGIVTSTIGTGMCKWTVGAAPAWADTSTKHSVSKLERQRRARGLGNTSYPAHHEAVMSLACPDQPDLARRVEDGYADAAVSDSDVVETAIGLGVALLGDHIILAAGASKMGWETMGRKATPLAGAACSLAI